MAIKRHLFYIKYIFNSRNCRVNELFYRKGKIQSINFKTKLNLFYINIIEMQIRANDSNILLSHLKFIKLLGELFINEEVVIFSL